MRATVDMLQDGEVVRGSVGGHCDPHETVPRLVRVTAARRLLPLADRIRTYRFDRVDEAVRDVHDDAVVKAVPVR